METEPIKDLEVLKRIYEDLIENNRVVAAEYLIIGCNLPLVHSDLLGLTFEDVDASTVLCKSRYGTKSVEVEINRRVSAAIKRLKNYYIKQEMEPTYLFRSISRRAYHLNQPVHHSVINGYLRESATKLKLNYRLTLKSLSKTYAYHAFINGVNINDIQQLFLYDGRRQVLKLVGGEDYRNVDKGRDDELERAREKAIQSNKMVDYDWNVPPLSDPWLLEDEDIRSINRTITLDDVLDDVFLDKAEIEGILNILKRNKNVILQGAPGVGKTYVAKKIAQVLSSRDDYSLIGMVQFHQSYSYEEFVQGYRPGSDGFELKRGVFYEFCEKAKHDPNKKYVFIIDEVNRGNISKIFGELMVLIERDKRSEDWAMPLNYRQDSDKDFYIPNNVFLIGLMNTADRSLSMIDYALRRRFSFVNLEPKIRSRAFREYLSARGAGEPLIDKLISRVSALNDKISQDVENLGPGFCVGHSFFCQSDSSINLNEEWLEDVFRFEIIPLVSEYWFDDPTVVARISGELLA